MFIKRRRYLLNEQGWIHNAMGCSGVAKFQIMSIFLQVKKLVEINFDIEHKFL